MDSGCGEYGGGYDDGFHAGCRSVNNTYDNCQILSQGYESFCQFHSESPNCVEFLHNATNKRPAESGICAGMGDPRLNITCSKENDPESYCRVTDDPVFCNTVGDICDVGGFIKPVKMHIANLIKNLFF